MQEPHSLRQRLERDVVLGAEGYIFELERRGYVKAGPFTPEVVLRHPEAVLELHREFIRAGAEVVVACTYYGHREKLREAGLEAGVGELNLKAMALARQAARETGGHPPPLVAGNLSNTWVYDPADDSTHAVCRAMFDEQVGWAADSGADFLIAETFSHLGEASLALEAANAAGLPAVVTFIPSGPRTCDGYTFARACRILADRGALATGLNCGRGPVTMLPLIREIRDAVDGFVVAQPVPYRTTFDLPTFNQLPSGNGNAFPVALDPYLLTRFEMADFAARAREMGVNYVGICCGGAPHHVRAMAEALDRSPPAAAYSPELALHPVFGDADHARPDHVHCVMGPDDAP
jgi:betaine-homocysteine S-methyltransferase